MGTLYFDTGGAATNSGTTDANSAPLSGSAATLSGSVLTLDGSPDLSGLVTSGAAQSAIALAQATNSNQKIFWITAFDNTAKTVTVSVAPTGITSSAWVIGGRMVLTPANYESALRPGDRCILNNSPAARTTPFVNARVNGDNTNPIFWEGKAGATVVLNVTNTQSVLNGVTAVNWHLKNLTLDQDGASGNVVSGWTSTVFEDIRIIDGGGNGFAISNDNHIISCDISGIGGDGVAGTAIACRVIGSYIHDLTGNGITLTHTSQLALVYGNIIESCGGRGIILSGAPTSAANMLALLNNTIALNGDSGLEVADADYGVINIGNIFFQNGNAAGEYNVEYSAGSAETNIGYHGYNIFYHSGGGGGANLSGLTANATELTTDPLFTDSANGDFSISVSSPAKGVGFPAIFPGALSHGYPDIGAVQRLEPAAGSGGSLIGGRLAR